MADGNAVKNQEQQTHIDFMNSLYEWYVKTDQFDDPNLPEIVHPWFHRTCFKQWSDRQDLITKYWKGENKFGLSETYGLFLGDNKTLRLYNEKLEQENTNNASKNLRNE